MTCRACSLPNPLSRTRIHILGASGAGTTTLGRAVADSAGIPHFDADDFYWLPTQLPYRVKREPAERIRLLSHALDAATSGWVLSGSICGWGDAVIPRLQLAVFLVIEVDIRLQRLRDRELQRYGAGLLTDGDLAAHYESFMAWAAQYDEGGFEVRSRALHERWIGSLTCPLLRLDSSAPVDELAATVLRAVE